MNLSILQKVDCHDRKEVTDKGITVPNVPVVRKSSFLTPIINIDTIYGSPLDDGVYSTILIV